MLKSLRNRFQRHHKTQNYRPVILVTGCGSGLGWALVEMLYTQTQYRVVATARRRSQQALKEKFPENERFIVRELNVAIEKQRQNLIYEIERLWGGVDILINNAGISYRAVVEHMTDEDEFLQMQTNYLGPLGLTRLVLPSMRLKGRGKIINVSSVSGMLAMPTMASYTASKYALEGVSEALWYEVKPLGINVSLIQPGFVKSESFRNVYYTEKSRFAEAKGADEAYGDYYANMTPFITRLMNMSLTPPRSIAKLVFKVIRTENPPLWIPATFDAMVFYYLRRFIPRRFLLMILFAGLPRVRRWGMKYTNRRK